MQIMYDIVEIQHFSLLVVSEPITSLSVQGLSKEGIAWTACQQLKGIQVLRAQFLAGLSYTVNAPTNFELVTTFLSLSNYVSPWCLIWEIIIIQVSLK